jgi:DNA-binding CsgD family transcriptional regulator
LSELLKTLAAERVKPDRAHLPVVGDLGPRSVSRAVLLGLSRLTADATTFARALAVLGDGADLAVVAALAGLDEVRAGETAAMLVRAEIVQAEPPLAFVHPLVAGAVYRDLTPGERQLWHGRAAELLRDAGAHVEQVAGHLMHTPARGAQWVVRTLTSAGGLALRTGAPDSAVAYLERALREPPADAERAEIVFELGRARALVSWESAVADLRQAYDQLEDPERAGAAAQLLARALLFSGEPGEAAEFARAARARLPQRLVDVQASLIAFESFCVLFGAGDGDVLARLRRYRTVPVGERVGAKMLAAIAAQEWMYDCGPSDQISALSLAALAGGELIAADNGLVGSCAITNLTFADHEDAERWRHAARAEAHRRGSLVALLAVNLWHGHTLFWRGELIDAEQILRAGMAGLGLWGLAELQAHIYFHAFLSSVLRERGRVADARAALELSRDPRSGDDGARYWLGSQLGLLLAERRFEQAVVVADEYARRFSGLVRNPMDVPWRSCKALALDQLGHTDDALALAADELELSRQWGAPGTVARSLRALGTLEREDGIEHLEEAVDTVAGTPARLEHAKSLVAFGSALRRARRPSQAREPLRTAFDLATSCGADQLAEQARTELYAAGARPRASAFGGVAALTASERRVAALVAEGRTNREVAETLFVTPKTVEMHLGNVYRKLGVSSRRELPATLAG